MDKLTQLKNAATEAVHQYLTELERAIPHKTLDSELTEVIFQRIPGKGCRTYLKSVDRNRKVV